VLVESEISVESHAQGFDVIGEGNLGTSDSRCIGIAKTLPGAKQNGL